MARDGWSALFSAAFKKSKNPMALVDEARVVVDVNPAGGPIFTESQWSDALAAGQFHGDAELVCADGSHIGVQFAAAVEVATGRRLVLYVALSTSRWGASFRRSVEIDRDGDLSPRELEIVRLIAHGETGPEIADELHIAHDTVRTHVANAMRKVGARSRAHLVAKVLAEGHALG